MESQSATKGERPRPLLFLSRFRKERHTADVEKGDGKDGKEGKEGESSHARKLSAAEDSTGGKGRSGKWGRLLGNIPGRDVSVNGCVACGRVKARRPLFRPWGVYGWVGCRDGAFTQALRPRGR